MQVAEDRDGYKRHLVATLFADVLQKGQSVGEQKAEEQVRQQNEMVAENRPEETNDEDMSPKRQFQDNFKEKHSDALYLIRAGGVYRLYNEDAAKGADILGITMRRHPEYGFLAFAELPRTQLDSHPPKLVHTGERVVISEIGLQDKRQDEQETHRGIHRQGVMAMTKNQEYALQYADYAMAQMRRYGIPASIASAQGILESSNGQSRLARNENNHSGVRTASSWIAEGGKCGIYTNDKPNEKFCSYNSVGDSYEHHSRFLKENSRYVGCFKLSPGDYKGWVQSIEKAGYVTGGKYAENLQKIIRQNGLQKYGRQVMQEMAA